MIPTTSASAMSPKIVGGLSLSEPAMPSKFVADFQHISPCNTTQYCDWSQPTNP